MANVRAERADAVLPYSLGGWLPTDPNVLRRWIGRRIVEVRELKKSRGDIAYDPVIQQFQTFIESTPTIRMGFTLMFEQAQAISPPDGNEEEEEVNSYERMLELFDLLIKKAPDWEEGDLVGFPINAVLVRPMCTPAGYAIFMDKEVNEHFKNMFAAWFTFLASSDSRTVIPNWISNVPDFTDSYDYPDPADPYYGYKSWDDFFTRSLKAGIRPIDPREDAITSACESKFLKFVSNVQERDQFWIKDQPYSLADILHKPEYVQKFIGGTIYQAFLSATTYHRWHSPVDGVIKDSYSVPGTYYAQCPAVGSSDPSPPDLSQAFITSVAARAVIVIEADNTDIGTMCFVGVGMAEVSTCQITVYRGQRVSKGDQLGMFHFGGSTHCLIFDREVKLTLDPNLSEDKILLNSSIAFVEHK